MKNQWLGNNAVQQVNHDEVDIAAAFFCRAAIGLAQQMLNPEAVTLRCLV